MALLIPPVLGLTCARGLGRGASWRCGALEGQQLGGRPAFGAQLCDPWPVAAPLWVSTKGRWNDEWEVQGVFRPLLPTLIWLSFWGADRVQEACCRCQLRAAGLGVWSWQGERGEPPPPRDFWAPEC